MSGIIVILFILYIVIKNSINGKEKKVTPRSILLLPALMLYYIYESLITVNNALSIFALSIFGLSIIIGSIIGFYRSKLYSFRLENGELYYKRNLLDAFALIALMIFDTVLRVLFKTYDNSLFSIVNFALILFASSSIIFRRVIILFKYLNVKGAM